MDDSREKVLKAAAMLAPDLSARAEEGEALRTMPADLVERVSAAGLFGMWRPRSLGGLELDPTTMFEVIEELSRADGSAGWTVMIGNGGSGIFAWLDPDVARDMIGDDVGFASTSMFGPLGWAVPEPGPGGDTAFTVDGRWPFNSGCPHARWFQTGVFVTDGAGPRMLPNGAPDWRFAYFRPDQAEIVETWDAAGLCGTGSHDVVVRSLRLPAEQFAAPMYDLARHDGPMWRIPFLAALGMQIAAFPLGVARRALDEFTALAPAKRRPGSPQPVSADSHAQIELAHAEGGVQAARAFVIEAMGEVWDTACAGDPPSLHQRARVLLAGQNAMRAATAAVDTVFRLAGAGAVYSTHPLQRCLRDIHTAGQHIFFADDAWARYSRHRFGIEQPTYMF